MPSRHLYLCYVQRKAANLNVPESERNRSARALIKHVQEALAAERSDAGADRSATDEYHRILQRAARVFSPWRGPPAR